MIKDILDKKVLIHSEACLEDLMADILEGCFKSDAEVVDLIKFIYMERLDMDDVSTTALCRFFVEALDGFK
jgi:hypothetical protein